MDMSIFKNAAAVRGVARNFRKRGQIEAHGENLYTEFHAH